MAISYLVLVIQMVVFPESGKLLFRRIRPEIYCVVLTHASSFRYSGADKDSLHKFLGADLDYLVVAVPLTWVVSSSFCDMLYAKPNREKTHHMLSTAEFQVLSKRRAFISNIARGQIIDQAALIAALQPQELENPSQADKSNRMPRIHFNPESLDPSRPNAFPLLRGAALDVTDPEPLQPECPLWYLPHVTITPHIS